MSNSPTAITYHSALDIINAAKDGLADADTPQQREDIGEQLLELAEKTLESMPHLAVRAALWANCAFDTGMTDESRSTFMIGIALERAHKRLKEGQYFEGIIPLEGNTVTITDLHEFMLDKEDTAIGSCHIRHLLAERDIIPIEAARMALSQGSSSRGHLHSLFTTTAHAQAAY
jgi:hypothetical protein